MESKVFGVPLAVWVFVIGLGLIIGLPLWLTYKNEMVMLGKINDNVLNNMRTVVLTPTPIATPSATPTLVPASRVFAPIKPTASVK